MGNQADYDIGGIFDDGAPITRMSGPVRAMPEHKRSRVDRAVAEELKRRETDRQVAERIAMADAYGDDVWPDGQVATFAKRFCDTGHTYSYAAIKVGDYWFTTGPRGQQFSWHQLVAWLVSDSPVQVNEVHFFAGPDTEQPLTTYDENTLQKVQRALADCGMSNNKVTQVINELLNAGILFRERVS